MIAPDLPPISRTKLKLVKSVNHQADGVMFELQDLPCVHQADVDFAQRTARVSHSNMIAAEDIVVALGEAGYAATVV